jgi:hypothetical protein
LFDCAGQGRIDAFFPNGGGRHAKDFLARCTSGADQLLNYLDGSSICAAFSFLGSTP